MKDIILDIRDKASRGVFKNEEQVRVCIVYRVLQALEWDIWNPSEVYPEYLVVPTEDASRIDVALFLRLAIPTVFIEVKAVGKLEQGLEASERQLRDYNRNNAATFTVLTDGIRWRFYYSKASGEFRQRLFKVIDLARDEVDDVEVHFTNFLAKSRLTNALAERQAQEYIESSIKERTMYNSMSNAKRFVLEPPYPPLPEALRTAALEVGVELTLEEARQFVSSHRTLDETSSVTERVSDIPSTRSQSGNARSSTLPPNGTKCRFTYASRDYRGTVINGHIRIEGMPDIYRSFSAASVAVSNTSRNGWKDWDILLPGSNGWQLADTWRSTSNGT